MKFTKRMYDKRFNFLGLYITLAFLGLIFYSSRLQIVNHEIYANEVNNNTIKQRKLPAPRGNIEDRNGIVLATTEYQNDLYVIPHYFHDDINLICANVKINCTILATKLDDYPLNRLLVATNIPDELAEDYKRIPGLFVFRFAKRQYNTEAATTHIVGYVGKIGRNILDENEDALYADDDYVGQAGLESVYDHEIHGLNGAEQYAVQANGLELLAPNRFLPKDKVIIKPVKGNNLILSIDDRLQLVLARGIGWRNGAAVILDVHTGAVLAMYSSPGFNPQHIGLSFNNKNYPLLNRAIRSYAPGSTFKLVVALAALEMGVIKPTDTFNCPGYFIFGGRVFHCWKHGSLGNGHGKIILRDAIKESCDVFFYNLSLKVGLKNIIKYAHMLGIDEYTGIDLDNESKGSIVGRIKYKGAIINTAIGQGEVLVSPLQLARAYATIINGGNLYVPRIVSGSAILLRQSNFKQENIDILMDALHAVIMEPGGTAYYSRIPNLEVGGKTGSAQIIGLNKKGIKDNGIFVGYFPITNPQIVVSVIVEGSEHGSLVAPIALEAIEFYSQLYSR